MIPVDSLSSTDRVEKCAPSAVLPQAEGSGRAAVMGSALHEHMHMRAALGVDSAMARIDEVAARWELDDDEKTLFAWRCRTFEWSPPAGAFGEVALCLREDGAVERVVGGRGRYDVPPDAVTAGTLDVMWSFPEPLDLTDPEHPRCPKGSDLWVVDYKSGDEDYVVPVETNLQVGGETLLAARWTGAEMAMPVVLFIRPGQGEWDAPAHVWEAPELAAIEARLRAMRARKVAAWNAHRAGEPLRFNEGPWCQWCKARWACPPKLAMVKALAGDPQPLAATRMTDEQRRVAVLRLKVLDGIVREARETLKRDVDEHGAIDLGNGLVYGPERTTSRVILPKPAMPILLDELGEEAYGAIRITKGAVTDLVKARAPKGSGAKAVRAVMGKLEDAGAVHVTEGVEYSVHRADSEDALELPREPPLLALLEASTNSPAPAPDSGVQLATTPLDLFADDEEGPL